jgi:hypothetical protein
VPIIQFQKEHGGTTFRALERIVTKSMENGCAPFVEPAVERMLFAGYRPDKLFVDFPMSGIDAAITDHFEMFFRDVTDQALDKIQDGNSFLHIFIIFMAVVVESDSVTVVLVDTGCSDNRPSEITAYILGHCLGITFIRLGVHIEAVLMIFIAGSLYLFKRRTKVSFHFVEKSSAEGIAKERVIKMLYVSPEAVITVAAFGDQAMDMRVPFKIASKGVEDHDKTGGEVFGLIHVME